MSKKPSFFFCQLLLSIFFCSGAMADEATDIEYSELLPLATKSMLLDVSRSSTGFVAVGERGHVITSSDGRNWAQAEVVPTRATLTTVFSVGDRLWAAGHDTVILTSGDGGKTWTRQMFDPERLQGVMDINFSDELNGVATGSYGLVLSTTDGGKTWDDGAVDVENEYHLNSQLVFSDGRRMIAGEAGYSYRSFDNGESWEAMEMPYQGSMWGSISLANDCIIFYGLRGHIMESCDFGDTWQELNSGTQASISDAAEDGGMLVLAGNGGAVLTRDGNGPFSVHQHSSGVDFAAVLALGDGRFLLAGEDGVHEFPESSGVADD